MPSNAQVAFTPGTLSPNYCFTTWQQVNLDIIAQLTGYLPGNYSTFNFGDGTPTAANQDKPWIRTIGGVPERMYVFYLGQWIWPHPVPFNADEIRLWKGLEANLATYDGGTAVAVTETTGPFWEVDHTMDFRMPIGPGTLPIAGTVIAVGDVGGTDQVTLTIPNIPPHDHGPDTVTNPNRLSFTANTSVITGFGTAAGGTFDLNMLRTGKTGGDGVGATTPINKMNPYIGRFAIKRTARKYYTP